LFGKEVNVIGTLWTAALTLFAYRRFKRFFENGFLPKPNDKTKQKIWHLLPLLYGFVSVVWIQILLDVGVVTLIAVCFGRWVEVIQAWQPLTLLNFVKAYSFTILSFIIISFLFTFQEFWKFFHFTKLTIISLISFATFYIIIMATFQIWIYQQLADPLRTTFFWTMYPELRILWALVFVSIIKKPVQTIQDLPIKQYYVKGEFYDWVTQPRRFEKIFHSKREKAIVQLTQKYFKGSISLDVGCGTGLITRHLNSNYVVGIDINKWNLEKAKLHANKIDVVLADVEHLPIRSDAITNVVCTEVLEHLPSPKNAINEILRVLKPKGKLVCSVPSKNPVWKFRKLFLTTCPVTEPFHNSYNVDEVKRLLGQFLQLVHVFPAVYYMSIFAVATKNS
jgi:ubiquinone/menaquinone biosynthesis C-methylase UbiE